MTAPRRKPKTRTRWDAATLKIVSQAMAALESDATLSARRAAWDGLRDHFYPWDTVSAPTEGDER